MFCNFESYAIQFWGHFKVYFRSIFGLFFVYFWSIFGLFMVYFRSIFGLFLVHFWSIFWASFGLLLVYFWSIFGLFLVYFWSIFGLFEKNSILSKYAHNWQKSLEEKTGFYLEMLTLPNHNSFSGEIRAAMSEGTSSSGSCRNFAGFFVTLWLAETIFTWMLRYYFWF